MSERSDLVLIDDMLEAVERTLAYTYNMELEAFSEDTKTSDAVLRNLQVLGEAANKVSTETRQLMPEIEWTKIIRSRNIVVHEYFGVDYEVVWRIVKVHLPILKDQLDTLLKKLEN